MGCSKCSTNRERYRNAGLPEDTKISKNFILYVKEPENEEQMKAKGGRKNEIVKIRAEKKRNRELKGITRD